MASETVKKNRAYFEGNVWGIQFGTFRRRAASSVQQWSNRRRRAVHTIRHMLVETRSRKHPGCAPHSRLDEFWKYRRSNVPNAMMLSACFASRISYCTLEA
jgi:hypothetical protein